MEIIVIRHIFHDHREVLEPLEAIWQVLALLQKRTIDISESAMSLNGIFVIITIVQSRGQGLDIQW